MVEHKMPLFWLISALVVCISSGLKRKGRNLVGNVLLVIFSGQWRAVYASARTVCMFLQHSLTQCGIIFVVSLGMEFVTPLS